MGTIIQGPWKSERNREKDEAKVSAEVDRWLETFLFDSSHSESKSYIGSDVVNRLFAATKQE